MTVGDSYRTVAGPGRAAFEIRGSEFVGHAARASTVEEAAAFVDAVAEEHPEASHAVPAYRVRVGDGTGGHLVSARSDDDGEPTGSAGKPALNVLEQRGLENVVVAIARYFGGTELGVGGLARAYSRAAKEAVDDAGVVKRRPHVRVAIAVDYDDSGTVRGILESEGVEFEAEYGARAAFDALVPAAEAEALRDRVKSATGGRAELEEA